MSPTKSCDSYHTFWKLKKRLGAYNSDRSARNTDFIQLSLIWKFNLWLISSNWLHPHENILPNNWWRSLLDQFNNFKKILLPHIEYKVVIITWMFQVQSENLTFKLLPNQKAFRKCEPIGLPIRLIGIKSALANLIRSMNFFETVFNKYPEDIALAKGYPLIWIKNSRKRNNCLSLCAAVRLWSTTPQVGR